MVPYVKTVEEFNLILDESGDKLVVVDFTAIWCGPCRTIGPFFEELSKKPENSNVVFLKVDVDDASEVAEHCKVQCMPTFHFYKNGKKIHEFSGADKAKLEKAVDTHKN